MTEKDPAYWLADANAELVPAATVVLVRDGHDGLEVLMLRRNSTLDFAGGMWVFPGGRVDEADREGAADEEHAARRAAVREAEEEAGLHIDEGQLVWIAHWQPPQGARRRFATWFFLAPAPPEDAVRIDMGEIHDAAWMGPAAAKARRDALEIELAPPTWVTLDYLSRFPDVQSALTDAISLEPEYYETHIGRVEGVVVALWHGDAGYHESDPEIEGARHRLWMLTGEPWRFERDGEAT
jgi:8-oxo-dGTP pyrophosphatase MutT (NUDIX family)